MSTGTYFYSFTEALAEKKHNLGADTLKVFLSLVAPVVTNAVKADLTEIATGAGYSAGGPAVTIDSAAQTLGAYKLVLADKVITASGGDIGPFRYVTLYNDTAASDELIKFWDYGASVTIPDGETFTIDFDGSAGVLTLAPAA
jgi:hypothetical protein